MTKQPYVKAIGMSLLIHSILLAMLVVLGQIIDPVSYAMPIEVELVPASVLDTGPKLTDSNPPALDSRVVANQLAVAAPEQVPQKQALPTEDLLVRQSSLSDTQQVRDTTVVQAIVAEVATVGLSSAVRGQESKPKVRTRASHISGLRPAYPYEARHAGWEGTVVLRILVATDGSPATVSVGKSSGYSVLDEAAVQAVKNWRFSPARQGDNPVESYYDMRVKFNLADE